MLIILIDKHTAILVEMINKLLSPCQMLFSELWVVWHQWQIKMWGWRTCHELVSGYFPFLMWFNNWGEPEQAPLWHGEQYDGPCAKNLSEKWDCNTLGTVVYVQASMINLRIIPYKCFVIQKYLSLCTDIPYQYTKTVNHTTNSETVKIMVAPY